MTALEMRVRVGANSDFSVRKLTCDKHVNSVMENSFFWLELTQ
jgi:hypothetical protein